MTLRHALERFLLPEKEVTLKLIFDNIRNYFICGAILGMAFWFTSGKATAPPFIFRGPPKDNWQLVTWSSIAVFFLLFVLNGYQSYLIGRRTLSFLEEMPDTSTASTTSSPSAKRRFNLGVRFTIKIVALTITLLFIFLILTLAMLAIYISWFAAVRGS